jgi:hypothetical protein
MPAMPEHQPVAIPEPPAPDRDQWFEETEELPRRPRRRPLGGVAGNPIALALLGVLLIACGFIGGVLVEKGEGSSSPSAGGAASLASRFAALRGGASSTGARSGATGAAGGFGGSSSSGAGFTRPTAGTVAYLDGSTLYVTNTEGNTVKVTTSAATSVNKTVKASVSGIRPGETVTVTGSSGANGAVSAEAISVGSSGGGLAALLGASGFGGGRAGSGGAAGGNKEPQLFGGGG